jgi:leader peptidase (prepilin peptidase)/N-methyltransferase
MATSSHGGEQLETQVNTLYLVALGIFGALFGSFANVVIYRLPRRESLSLPRSHCPECGELIRWYDNIPVVSWVLLRARCRDCGQPISGRYPAVELLSAGLFLLAGVLYGMTFATLNAVLFFYTLLLLAFIDLDTLRLPNVLVGLLGCVGLVSAISSEFLHVAAGPLIRIGGSEWLTRPIVASGLGAALGLTFTGGVAAIYSRTRGRTGFGVGDVKLTTVIGLFLGPYVLLAVFFGNIFALVAAILWARRSRARNLGGVRIPFGPFLAIGSVVTTAVGPQLLAVYFRAVGIG